MKIEINKVAEICKKNMIDPATLRRIVEEMNLAAQPDPGEESEPTVKKQWVILISDPDGKMPKHDFVGWVLQIPEIESVATTQERIFRGAYDFNASKKGRLLPAKTVGDAIENIPAKHFKEAEVWVKSKTPVLVLRTDNEIPMSNEPSDKVKELAARTIAAGPATVAAVRNLIGVLREHGTTMTMESGGKKVTVT